jgi:hypothetical protein
MARDKKGCCLVRSTPRCNDPAAIAASHRSLLISRMRVGGGAGPQQACLFTRVVFDTAALIPRVCLTGGDLCEDHVLSQLRSCQTWQRTGASNHCFQRPGATPQPVAIGMDDVRARTALYISFSSVVLHVTRKRPIKPIIANPHIALLNTAMNVHGDLPDTQPD